MTAVSNEIRAELIDQTAERINEMYAEKFRQERIDHWHKERAERKEKESGTPVESAVSNN